MIPYDILAAGAACWVATLVYVTFDRHDLHWDKNTISHYLVGPGGNVLAAGFFAFAVGLLFLAIVAPFPADLLFFVGGVGIAVAGATKQLVPDQPAHLIGARLAYACAGAGMILDSGAYWWAMCAAIAAAIGTARLAVLWYGEDWTAMAERTVAAVYLAWIALVVALR